MVYVSGSNIIFCVRAHYFYMYVGSKLNVVFKFDRTHYSYMLKVTSLHLLWAHGSKPICRDDL